MTLPAGSVSVTMVLLKVARTNARPRGMFLRSRRRTRVLPRPGPVPRRRSAMFCPYLRMLSSRDFRWPGRPRGPSPLLLLADPDRPPRAAPRARVGARALAPHRHAAAVPQAAIRADIHQPLNVHRDLAPQIP